MRGGRSVRRASALIAAVVLASGPLTMGTVAGAATRPRASATASSTSVTASSTSATASSTSATSGNPLSGGLNPVAPTPTTPTTAAAPPVVSGGTATTASGSSSLSASSAIAIALAALVVLAGISLAIWRDARRRAPNRSRAATATGPEERIPGSKRVKPRKLSPAERRRRRRGRAPRRR